MRDQAAIEKQRRALMVVAADDSPVPEIVRDRARMLCHALTWVLMDSGPQDVLFGQDPQDDVQEPYFTIAGCCCGRDGHLSKGIADGSIPENDLTLGCALGPHMCLCPGGRERHVPDVLDIRLL